MKREISVSWNQVNSVKDIKVLPEADKAISCATNGNFVDVWGFQLTETSNKSSTQHDFDVLIESNSHQHLKQYLEGPVPNLEKKVSDISLAASSKDEEEEILEDESPIRAEVPKSEASFQPKPENLNSSAPPFKYIPKVDGSNPVNLDLASFLKQVISISFFATNIF